MSTVHESAAEEPPSRAQPPRSGSYAADPATNTAANRNGQQYSAVATQHVPPHNAHLWRSKNPLNSFRHAVEGVAHAFRTQRNMRFHLFTFVLVLLSGLMFRLRSLELLALLFAASFVLVAEMINTAIEAVVDMITQSYHPAAKFAKDIAAGAVLIASLNAVAVAAVLFLGAGRPQMVRHRLQEPPALYIFFTGVLLLFAVLMIWKIRGAKGTLLHGGIVSGHSAFAFFLATTILFFADNWFASALAFLLAAMVAQSRVEARVHTVQEVIIGAVLAIFLSACIYRMPHWIAKAFPFGVPDVAQQPLQRPLPVTGKPAAGGALTTPSSPR